jgi:hypothetical protein
MEQISPGHVKPDTVPNRDAWNGFEWHMQSMAMYRQDSCRSHPLTIENKLIAVQLSPASQGIQLGDISMEVNE